VTSLRSKWAAGKDEQEKEQVTTKATAAFLGLLFLLEGCDEEETADMEAARGFAQPSQSDLLQGEKIANSAGANALAMQSSGDVSLGNGDLSVLGGNADQNQQAFRQRYGLNDPTADQLANWQQYNARLTAYSDKDFDWPFPTASSSNWLGSTWNGDPLAVEGTTVAVDFNRIPRGSLLYIPSLDMYAEANDTGATGQWAQTDSGLSDYGANGAGRIDIYNLAASRSSGEVERNFANWVGTNEFGPIYVVSRGSGWKKGGQ
jgi:3D (Asp-Asp-Asp) domain-containing protein